MQSDKATWNMAGSQKKPILNRAVRNEKERRYVPKRRIEAVKGAPMGWIVNPLILNRDRSVQAELGGRIIALIWNIQLRS